MQYSEEHLARMNRSGQRGGAVGSKPTVVTRMLQRLERDGRIRKDQAVLDFGAGKRAAQTALLRDEGWEDVTPHDIGTNSHEEESGSPTGADVVLLSNVLNVQDSIESIITVLTHAWCYAKHGGLLICNLPREPRYGHYGEQDVMQALHWAGWDIMETEQYGSGRIWICKSR